MSCKEPIASLGLLPDAILEQIFQHLKFNDLLNLQLLCKCFHRLITPDLWYRLNIPLKLIKFSTTQLINKYGDLISIIEGYPIQEVYWRKILNLCPNLVKVWFQFNSFGGVRNLLTTLSSKVLKIKVLSLDLNFIPLNLPNLQPIDLNRIEALNLNFKNDINSNLLEFLVRRIYSDNLLELKLINGNFCLRHIFKIQTSFKKLRKLSLVGLTYGSNQDIKDLYLLQNLKHLDLQGTLHPALPDLNLPTFKFKDLAFNCNSSTQLSHLNYKDWSLPYQDTLPILTEHNLPKLSHLSLALNYDLPELFSFPFQLKSLDIFFTSNFASTNLKLIVESLPTLHNFKLSLSKRHLKTLISPITVPTQIRNLQFFGFRWQLPLILLAFNFNLKDMLKFRCTCNKFGAPSDFNLLENTQFVYPSLLTLYTTNVNGQLLNWFKDKAPSLANINSKNSSKVS